MRHIVCINQLGYIDGFKPPKRDLQRFAAITIGQTIVYGRKTRDTLPKSTLRHRRNICVSRSGQKLEDVIHLLAETCVDPWICGGGEVYNQTIKLVHSIYISIAKDMTVGTIKYPMDELKKFTRICAQDHDDHEFYIFTRSI